MTSFAPTSTPGAVVPPGASATAFPGIRGAGVSRLRPDPLLYALMAALFSVVWRLGDLFGVFSPLHLGIVLPGAALLFYAVDRDRRRRLRDIRSPITRWTLIMLLLMCASVPTALYPGLAFRFVTQDYAPNFILMICIGVSIRGFQDAERFALAQVAGCAFFSAVVLTRFHVGSDGRLGDLAYYDANDFAMLVVCTLPLAVYFARRPGSWTVRLLAIGAIGLFMLGVVRSGSRGGFLGLVAVAITLLLSFGAVPVRTRVGVVAVLALLMSMTASDRYWGFIQTLANPSQDYNWGGKSKEGRVEIWKRGLGYMAQHPLLGVGAQNFPVAEGELSSVAQAARMRGKIAYTWAAAHNSFVQIGAEIGVFGVISFITLLVVAFRTLFVLAKRRPPGTGPPDPTPALAQVLRATLIGYVVTAFFLSQAYAAYLYMTLGIIIGLTKLQSWQAPAMPIPARGTSGTRRLR